MMTEARREEIRKIIAQLNAAKDAIEQVYMGIYDDNFEAERGLSEEELAAKMDSESEDFSTIDVDASKDDVQRAIDRLNDAIGYKGGEYYMCYKED